MGEKELNSLKFSSSERREVAVVCPKDMIAGTGEANAIKTTLDYSTVLISRRTRMVELNFFERYCKYEFR